MLKNTKKTQIMIGFLLAIALSTNAQVKTDSVKNKKYQATPPPPQKFGAEAFQKSDKTVIRWLGNGGFLINSRGTTIAVDPLLKGFDMPVLFEAPVNPKEVPHLDAVLVTHSDNDHYSIPTLKDLYPVTKLYHSTIYVDSLMKNEGFKSKGHGIGESFDVGKVKIKLTPADHDWQNQDPNRTRNFAKEDCAGFLIETPDGTIWAQGDSRLMPEHLSLPTPDAILFDFSDNEWHFTLEGALKIAETYPNTLLILSHWGTVDAPDFTPFNADPEKLKSLVKNSDRLVVLAPGEPYVLSKLKK
ncbi:MBL fold metallo-hydrolase [Pedobacter sp.]|uniref:MBL fold metallo-hydrolase n=1 Tax=Pedobacter sp. TaxID=1411316 RepID=UPI003D7FD0E6